MPYNCPTCRQHQFTVIDYLVHKTEPFKPYFHQDPKATLVCNRCGWVGFLQWLQNFSAMDRFRAC